ncbi:MAG: type ISP restriction/modification enzyme [Actinomycetota bacterium]|nr:type ISP restriction/modification enzyme [Actinomycetota bacterium]
MSEATGGLPSKLVIAVADAVAAFGATVKPRLSSPVGEPEDQMRGPLEVLLASVAEAVGVRFTMMGEASLSDLKVRPDYACQVNGAISGYIEVKAPGKGADATRFKTNTHDGKQWTKLAALPNVMYTDGENWGLYRTGERVGPVVHLDGDIRTAGAKLTDPGDGLARLLYDFLHWEPIAPRNVTQLVATVAPLTRLLRDEVADTLDREAGSGPFTHLASDWRELLFPDASDAEFADEYAQAVTFALLLARSDGIDFTGKSIATIASTLGRHHSLMGKALGVLTDETIGALTVTLDTLVRVVSVVDFTRFPKHETRAYATLYESFLETYDNELRKQSGSYYTPAPVVAAMAGLTDQVLRRRLGAKDGFASPQVTVLDPATGTGQYPVEVLELIAAVVQNQEGPGAVPARLAQAAERIIGIEKQAGPYAVAEMRVAELLARHDAKAPNGGLRLYVADSLDDPFAEVSHLAATLEPIARSRRLANAVKASTPVMVVIGNPPYRERAKGHGGFIEHGSPNTTWAAPLLDAFREPGNGRAEYTLSNLYVYFWRLATWKVFDTTDDNDGVVCFITTSGYLKGPGFAGMRRYLRERCEDGWVIDCTPEGHQPDVGTRIFPGVQQPIAIGIFTRKPDTSRLTPGRIRYRAIHGRQADKFDQLKRTDIDDGDWEDCPEGWTAPFLPAGDGEWGGSPALQDLMPWSLPGVKPNRTWVYAPLPGILVERWNALINASPAEKPRMFCETRDANLSKRKPGLAGFPHSDVPMSEETGACLPPVAVSYRAFDLQSVIPDDRVLATPRPDLWRVRGDHQVFLTAQEDQVVKAGPVAVAAGAIPDTHYYAGRGGKVFPLYASGDTSHPNVAPGLLGDLSQRLGVTVTPEDFLAYLCAVTAHPAFIDRFAEDLRTPGVHVPLTADRDVWSDAVALGERLLWLHTRGERYTGGDRQSGPPRIEGTTRPLVREPINLDPLPDEMEYDATTRQLRVGGGVIAPVDPRVVAYEVSGMNVLRKWFGYRRATRPQARGEQSPLDDVRPTTWPTAYTTDLLDLLNVLTLVVELEPAQADLLDRVMAGPRITVNDLTAAGVLPVPDASRSLPKEDKDDPVQQLWLMANENRKS